MLTFDSRSRPACGPRRMQRRPGEPSTDGFARAIVVAHKIHRWESEDAVKRFDWG
jgi:hypothetical protein